RTRVDESHGVKQAFAMSAADVSSGKQIQGYEFTTELSSEAIAWRDKLRTNGTWLRSPGAVYAYGAYVSSNFSNLLGDNNVASGYGIVPVLVVHVE
uniref:hypothetical protein n=1 Tax=Lactococcus garvieae TaxID=1363 RepID=UPI00359C1999